MHAELNPKSRLESAIKKLGPKASGLFRLSEPASEGAIEIAKPELLTPAVISILKKHYDLEAESSKVNISAISDEQLELFLLDLIFFAQNPKLPLENICSHIANYEPRNDSQRELLRYALALVDMFAKDQSKAMGLYMHGQAGVGKSHMAVALTKEFMRRGLHANFIRADDYRYGVNLGLGAGQVWIIDDLNSGYGNPRDMFKPIILNAHDRGGVVFVTSNLEYGELIYQIFGSPNEANRIRYEDRTKSMFKILEVIGDSNRQADAWHALVDSRPS